MAPIAKPASRETTSSPVLFRALRRRHIDAAAHATKITVLAFAIHAKTIPLLQVFDSQEDAHAHRLSANARCNLEGSI
jgi:hypothetical protein